MITLPYLIAVSLCWLLLGSFYYFLLRREKFFHHNRFFLLAALIGGGLIPLLDSPFFASGPEWQALYQVELPPVVVIGYSPFQASPTSAGQGLELWLPALAFVGGLWALIRLFRQLIQILFLVRQGEKIRFRGYWLIRHPRVGSPFSFLGLLFWSPDAPTDGEEAEIMLRHEKAHIRQWHSLDILLLEGIGILFWWNPLWYFFRKELSEVHEYLADQEAIQETNVKRYGQLLIEQCLKGPGFQLTHGWNHSSLKNRIQMLTQKKSQRNKRWKYLLALPLVLVLIWACENVRDVEPEGETYQGDLDKVVVSGYKQNLYGKGSKEDQAVFDSDSYRKDQEAGEQKVFKVVQEMPKFGDCEGLNGDELKKCSDHALLNYIYKNINYPAEAREANVQGIVVASMTIFKDGSIGDVSIARSVHPALDKEVIRIMTTMSKWKPGKQNGEAVNVRIHLPVKFRLEEL
jgi:TonB family protein